MLKIKGPYNFDFVLKRLSLDPLMAVDLDNRAVTVPLWIGNEPIAVTVKATGTTENPEFAISSVDDAVITRLSEIFQWNIPLLPMHSHFQQTDLKGIFTDHYGTPLILEFDPYGCVLKCIIHQQLNLSFAHTLTERFVKQFGFEKDGVWFYPRPEVVAVLEVEDLRALQFSGRKAEYVIGIAKETAEGRLDFHALKSMSDEEIYDTLIKLRGIGAWTIQNFLMFGLGRQNLFPFADIGIQKALQKLYGLEKKPSQEEMALYSQNWQPYLSYASLYLWRSIE